MDEIAPNTFVADTPGIRALALQGVPPEMLPECFPEFRPYLGECFYADCTHIQEPGCAVLAARDASDISLMRWESYASLRTGAVDD
jgi:ribosome biogenesis GTPase